MLRRTRQGFPKQPITIDDHVEIMERDIKRISLFHAVDFTLSFACEGKCDHLNNLQE